MKPGRKWEDSPFDRPLSESRSRLILATRDLSTRALGTAVLRAAGFGVEVESSGEAILDSLDLIRPDLLLVELILDDMDAVDLCSRIRSLPSYRSLPILVMSDLLHTPTIHRVYREDFTDFVLKPFNWPVLAFRINRWISLARQHAALSSHKTTLEAHEVALEQERASALQASTEVLQLKNYDALTGLPNRKMFTEATALALSRRERSGGSLAVLYLDIEDFKEVNGLVGRSLGDEVLKIVAKRLEASLHEADVPTRTGEKGSTGTLSRFQGDQFVVLLYDVAERDGARTAAHRLLASFSEPISVHERQFRLTARVGIAESQDLDSSSEELFIQRAEIAMRCCKQASGQRLMFYDSSMSELVTGKLQLKTDLRRAIDGDEFTLHYQLLVDAKTGQPTGVEGLLRWIHPTRGLVPPGEFLPVAEQSDLIVALDKWVLRACCRQARQWLEVFPPLLVSINVSIGFLEESDFAREVLAILADTGLPPTALQLELSERGALPEAGRLLSQFEMLAAEGVQLALDDFGTGQTSLSYLQTLPVSCVKIDRSFVKRIPEDSASAAIVTAISSMSRHLGLKVVAEGVETEEQLRFLADLPCDELQGFLFGPARSPEAVAERLGDLRPVAGVEDWLPVLDPAAAVAAPTPALLELDDATPSDSGPAIDGQLLQLARRDFLTRLYNRFSFDERLDHALAHADRFGHKVALLLIDLDDFKYVNDTHGHAIGDGLLVALSERLQERVRRIDTLARFGGDEFAVILSEFHNVEDVTEFARRLLEDLSAPVEVEGIELRVHGSLGVATYSGGGGLAKDLVRQADLALYKAKDDGGNRVRFFASEMDQEVQQSLALARDLAGASERGELSIEYQPQVALESGMIVGLEALLRWQHPERGSVGPDRFIPIAEHCGEMRTIGSWMIRSACLQLAQWRETFGRDVRVSVNISHVQCRDPRFVDTILGVVRQLDLDPALLDLELNERLLELLPRALSGALKRLGEIGIGLTLDDFGSGPSALEHFQQFHFDRVKIDRSLVAGLGERPESTKVLSGIVALANKMGVQIIAEGIERPHHVKHLLAEGCQIGQGFFLCKPLPAAEIGSLIAGGVPTPA